MEGVDVSATKISNEAWGEFVEFPDTDGMELFADEVAPQFR